MHRYRLPSFVCVIVLAAGLAMALLSPSRVHSQITTAPIGQIAFLDDDMAADTFNGCDEITRYDVTNQRAVDFGGFRECPGQIALARGGDLAVSMSNASTPFLYVFRQSPSKPGNWLTTLIDDPHRPVQWVMGGAAGLSPDGEYILVPTLSGVEVHRTRNMTANSLGPVLSAFPCGTPAAIEFTSSSEIAYIVGIDGYVYSLNMMTLTAAGPRIPYPKTTPILIQRYRRTFATLSPDERYLAINTLQRSLTVIDLAAHSTAVVALSGMSESWGVRFNHASENRGLLVVNGGSQVGVYRFAGQQPPVSLAIVAVPPQPPAPGTVVGHDQLRIRAVAWTADGKSIIAAIQQSWLDWRVLDYIASPNPALRARYDFASCTYDNSLPGNATNSQALDVRTLNGPGLNPTPTPTVVPSTTPPPTVTPIPTDTPSSTPTPTSSPTATASPPPTTTPTITPTPAPLVLPLLLREQCTPGTQRVDVALVIDASSSMLEPTTSGGSKLTAATAAARTFLDQLHLSAGDQAAVISFNATATLLAPLTTDRTVLDAGLAGIITAQFTRIDLGIAAAHAELTGSRHRPTNLPVMIVLTDGRANPVPGSVAEDEARKVKADGVVVFTVGLGSDLDVDALRAMASRPDYFHIAPDAEALAGIYRDIAVAIPCPASAFWGRR
jgi:hypothetical protein